MPELLKKKPDMKEELVQLVKNYFSSIGVAIEEPLKITDCSGLSNPVFIITHKTNKIILRFFESSAADFEAESKIFNAAGALGIAPLQLMGDGKRYRIEEFYPGECLQFNELMNENVLSKSIVALCRFNYGLLDKAQYANAKVSDLRAYQFIDSKTTSWYWQSYQLYDKINQIIAKCEQISDLGEKNERAIGVLKEVYQVLYSDQEAFKAEFLDLLPEVNGANMDRVVVFSHNDVQENNIMVKWADEAHTDITETKLIDFEYSSLNYRGADLAGYLVENMIDNKISEEPFYAYHEERFPDFESADPSAPVNAMIRLYLQTYFDQFCQNNGE